MGEVFFLAILALLGRIQRLSGTYSHLLAPVLRCLVGSGKNGHIIGRIKTGTATGVHSKPSSVPE